MNLRSNLFSCVKLLGYLFGHVFQNLWNDFLIALENVRFLADKKQRVYRLCKK